MSMIVAIMGSANSKGNTAAAVDAILDGAMGLSTNYIRYHNLGKLNFIKDCNFSDIRGKGTDGIQDPELRSIVDDIASADAVLFATPLYFNFPTPQFCMVLDSLSCLIRENGSALAGKKAIVLVTCEKIDDHSKAALSSLVSAFEGMEMTIVSKMIYACEGGRFSENRAAVDKAVSVGAKFSKSFDVVPDSEVVRLG